MARKTIASSVGGIAASGLICEGGNGSYGCAAPFCSSQRDGTSPVRNS